jgi:hypothetical protein
LHRMHDLEPRLGLIEFYKRLAAKMATGLSLDDAIRAVARASESDPLGTSASSDSPHQCSDCGSTSIAPLWGGVRCSDCGRQWYPEGRKPLPCVFPTRRDLFRGVGPGFGRL